MICVIGHNIISPLGLSSEENYRAVRSGRVSLRRYENYPGIAEPFMASLFTPEQKESFMIDGLTAFESLACRSVSEAMKSSGMNPGDKSSLLIISTTKGNIELLENPGGFSPQREYPASAAEAIAAKLGFVSQPVVVCNACISGVSALILAKRLLEHGDYDNIAVCGIDLQGRFIISGFQAFKALSDETCRPFDADRKGLNLGEACATVILSRRDDMPEKATGWSIEAEGCNNDANHISAPSRTADGSRMALKAVMANTDAKDVSFLSLHGTATLYNDQMESLAVEGTGLAHVPSFSLKSVYGHTMGAAGILETILSMMAADDGIAFATRGYNRQGVTGCISVSSQEVPVSGRSFIKLLSGFGGCNAAIRLGKGNSVSCGDAPREYRTTARHHVRITPHSITVDGLPLPTETKGKAMLTEIYRKKIKDYPKFFKMDMLARLGFIASELLLSAEADAGESVRFVPREDRGVILFNRVSSFYSDSLHMQSINSEEGLASPAVFVYTLPNIVTGEIAIRNKFYGETCFYVLAARENETMRRIADISIAAGHISSVVTGWVDCVDDMDFEADIYLIDK